MTRNVLGLLLLLCISLNIKAQTLKDCSHDHTGLIPLTDLGGSVYRGEVGGLYPEGSNVRPEEYLNDCITHVKKIATLNHEGEVDEEGKIVMLGIGASNPGAEFNQFMDLASNFDELNHELKIVNGCVALAGISEINYTAADYWNTVFDILDEQNLTPEQVQVIWIEEENLGDEDTAFPGAAYQLVADYLTLLKVVKVLFPNTQICYLTARAYSGYAPIGEGGLSWPRDYLNGWAIKWFVENMITNEIGYDFDSPDAEIPLVTWGSYHWTDGSTPRLDGLFLDCEIDVGEDGLHLTGEGDYKMGNIIMNYFLSDTTAKYWFYEKENEQLSALDYRKSTLNLYPNPSTGAIIHVASTAFQLNEKILILIYASDGKLVYQNTTNYADDLIINLPKLNSGVYRLSLEGNHAISNNSFIFAK